MKVVDKPFSETFSVLSIHLRTGVSITRKVDEDISQAEVLQLLSTKAGDEWFNIREDYYNKEDLCIRHSDITHFTIYREKITEILSTLG